MNANLSQFLRLTGTAAGALFVLASVQTRAADAANADAFPNFESYIKVSGQAPMVSGDQAAFSNRNAQPANGGAGIEDLHITRDVSKTTTVVIDGRALSGAEDYLGRVNVAKNDVGTIDVGFKRFRTFYDGAGGFFPTSNQWNVLDKEERHTDRGKFWAEATLTLPNVPVVTVRYTNELRSGSKDSTIWSSSDFTGLPFTVAPNPITEVRKDVPSFIRLGERHENLELTVKQKVKNTDLQLTLEGDRTKNLDSRFFTNFPGEVIPWSVAGLSSAAQPAAKAALSPANWNNQAYFAQSDGLATKTSGLTFNSDTAINDKLSFHVGANYELLHSDISGARPTITATPTSSGVLAVATATYTGLAGGSRVKSYTGNVGFTYKATPDLLLKVALRGQDEYVRGSSTYSVIASTVATTAVPPTVTLTTTPRLAWSKEHQKAQTPVLEVRYTGIKDLSLYFVGSKRGLDGTERNTSAYNTLTAANGTLATNHVSEGHGDFTLGANWKASPLLTVRGEVFTKDHKDDSIGFETQVGDYYLLDSQSTGYKLTAIAKPDAMVSCTTRFVAQRSTMQVTGFLPTYPAFDSLDGKNYMLGETVDINPNAACYVQLNANVIYNVINTIYPRAGITVATSTVSAYDTNKNVQNSDNNYVTGSVLAGFVVNKDMDVQVQGNYYRAANGNPVLAAQTMPYGVAVRDSSFTVGVKLKVSDTWICNAKAGYFESKNDTSGGFANYHGPVAYFSFDHAL